MINYKIVNNCFVSDKYIVPINKIDSIEVYQDYYNSSDTSSDIYSKVYKIVIDINIYKSTISISKELSSKMNDGELINFRYRLIKDLYSNKEML